MKRAVIALCGVICASLSAPAFTAAGDGLQNNLKGTYQYVATAACTEVPTPGLGSAPGFSPPPEYLVLGYQLAISVNAHYQGTITFDGNGHASSAGTFGYVLPGLLNLTVNTPPFNQPYGGGTSTCDWTYSVGPDNSFTLDGNCTEQQQDGGQAGSTDEKGPLQVKGFMSLGGNVLIGGNTKPSEDASDSGGITLVRYMGGNEVYRGKQICIGGTTYVRTPKAASQ